MARRNDGTAKAADDTGETGGIQGARLEPIRVVERELTRPDGTKLRVKVPVYPPFRLEERSAAPEPRKRKVPDKKAS